MSERNTPGGYWEGLKASESAPSQVTAGEQVRRAAQDIVAKSRVQPLFTEDVVPILTRLVSAAKREGAIEAHEQDARLVRKYLAFDNQRASLAAIGTLLAIIGLIAGWLLRR